MLWVGFRGVAPWGGEGRGFSAMLGIGQGLWGGAMLCVV